MENVRIVYNPSTEDQSPPTLKQIAGLVFGIGFWLGVATLLFFLVF
ncbi:MAG: hypothetical protein OXH47_10105 [Paracoccaceae bacterium]|nr:hypothetical protein [Paracoccaceae bacterium]